MIGLEAQHILSDVNEDKNYRHLIDNALFDSRLGFLIAHDIDHLFDKRFHETIVLGYAVSGWQEGTDEIASEFRNISELSEIKPELRTLDRQGRGTGTRLYNTLEALCGAAEDYDEAGLYAVALDLHNLSDNRMGRHRQQARSFSNKAKSQVRNVFGNDGESAVANQFNRRTAAYDAVIWNQTPDGETQKARKGVTESPVTDRFMVIRRRNAILTRVGIKAVSAVTSKDLAESLT